MRTIDVTCDACGADPKESCTTKSGKRRNPHRARHDAASRLSKIEADRRDREAALEKRALISESLDRPMNNGADVAQFLKANLKLRVDRRMTCPEEGMADDVWIELLLCDEVIDRVSW